MSSTVVEEGKINVRGVDSPPVKKRPSFLSDIRDKKKGSGSIVKHVIRKEVRHDSMQSIAATELQDPQWVLNNHLFDPLSPEIIPEHGVRIDSTADTAQPMQQQKKHQINWLAQETRQKDLQLLEKSAQGKQKLRSTAMKYGW